MQVKNKLQSRETSGIYIAAEPVPVLQAFISFT